MIYTDGIHLVTDQWAKTKNIKDLVDFARKIRLKMHWLQDYHPIFGSEKGHPHFDLTTDQATRRALRAGAKMVSQRQLVCVLLTGEINEHPLPV